MSELPDYDDGHLVVAAIRLFDAREGRPATVDEAGSLLPWHVDKVSVVVRGLAQMGVLRALEGPYETRYELADHLALEKLENEKKGAGFADELAAFEAEKAEESEEMEALFQQHGEEHAPPAENTEELDRQYDDFKKKNQPKDPFGGG